MLDLFTGPSGEGTAAWRHVSFWVLPPLLLYQLALELGLGAQSVHYLLELRHRWAVGGVPAGILPPLFLLCISFQRMKSSQWPLLVIPGVKTYLDPQVLGP